MPGARSRGASEVADRTHYSLNSTLECDTHRMAARQELAGYQCAAEEQAARLVRTNVRASAYVPRGNASYQIYM